MKEFPARVSAHKPLHSGEAQFKPEIVPFDDFQELNIEQIFPKVDHDLLTKQMKYLAQLVSQFSTTKYMLQGSEVIGLKDGDDKGRADLHVDLVRSAALRLIQPNPDVDRVRQMFEDLITEPDITTSRNLVEQLGGGSNDLDVKCGGSGMKLTDLLRLKKLFFSIASTDLVQDFGGFDDDTLFEGDDGREYMWSKDETEFSWGRIGTNPRLVTGEISFKKHRGHQDFVFHPGVYPSDIEGDSADRRAGSHTSEKSQIALRLYAIDGKVYFKKDDLIKAKIEIGAPDTFRSISIDANNILGEGERAVRAGRTGSFFGSNPDLNFLDTAFNESGWDRIKLIFDQLITYLENGGEMNSYMQSVFVKEAAVMFEANPYYALQFSMRTNFLRIFPFFRNAYPGFEMSLLSSDALTFLQSDKAQHDRGVRLIDIKMRNPASIPANVRLWDGVVHNDQAVVDHEHLVLVQSHLSESELQANWYKNGFSGLKLFYEALYQMSRSSVSRKLRGDEFELLFGNGGVFSFKDTPQLSPSFINNGGSWHLVNLIMKQRDELTLIRERKDSPYERLRIGIETALNIIAEGLSTPRRSSLINFKEVFDEDLAHAVGLFLCARGILTRIGEHIYTYTPPIITEVIEQTSQPISGVDEMVMKASLVNLLLKARQECPSLYRRCVKNMSTDSSDPTFRDYFYRALKLFKRLYNPATVYWNSLEDVSGYALPAPNILEFLNLEKVN